MKYKTFELEGRRLNQAVGVALQLQTFASSGDVPIYRVPSFIDCPSEDPEFGDDFEPSTRWDHGGPIIERERINIQNDGRGLRAAIYTGPGTLVRSYKGDAVLVAAMRAFVASKLGDEVELP